MSSSLSASHQSHMNVVDSRKQAIKFLNSNKGITVWNVTTRIPKGRMITSIKKGFFDGYYYRQDFDAGKIIFMPINTFYDTENAIHLTNRIG
jgi:hypothetical protein